MLTFLKANIASIIASLIDYLITLLAVAYFKTDVVLGGVIGTISGGVVNFLLGRNWVFSAENNNLYAQAGKYTLVWVGNLILNAAGMYALAKLAGFHYMIAKACTSVLVGIGYNYVLQKKYVFKNN
ncbi:MAG: GtrA family protein [Flavitalea sp.]